MAVQQSAQAALLDECRSHRCPCSTNIGYAYCGSTNGVQMAVNSK